MKDEKIRKMLFDEAIEQGYGDDARAVIRLFSKIIDINGLKGLRDEIDYILKYECGEIVGDDRPIKCAYCDEEIEDDDEYNEHLVKEHPEETLDDDEK